MAIDDGKDEEDEESTVATVLRISKFLSWMLFRASRARPRDDLRRRWAKKEEEEEDARDDGEPSAVCAVTDPPCLQR